VEDTAAKDLRAFLIIGLSKKAPFQLPVEAREFIVRYGPWIAIVLLACPVILVALGVGAVRLPFAAPSHAPEFGLGVAVLLLELVLDVAALPGLFISMVFLKCR